MPHPLSGGEVHCLRRYFSKKLKEFSKRIKKLFKEKGYIKKGE